MVLSRVLKSDDKQIVMLYEGCSSLYRTLSKLRFYHIRPNAIRKLRPPGVPYLLHERGENLASVLKDMQDGHTATSRKSLQRIREAMHHLIPGVSDLRTQSVGGYLLVQLRYDVMAGAEKDAWLSLDQESDGTVRLLGLLVALYQDSPDFIGIEEPELAVHPGILEAVAENFREAALRSQLLVTTHSPDFIDSLPMQDLRVVGLEGGMAMVGPVSAIQKQAIRDHLFSAGELHSAEGLQLSGWHH